MSAADRITETILRMGDIRAQGLQRSAAIQAQREVNNAQIWGGTIGNLGQQISQIPVDIQKAKLLDTENQVRQGQLDQQKKFQNDLFNANEIYQYTTRPGPDGSVQFDEDKLPAMVQKMSAAGINPDVVEHFAGAYKGMNQTMSSFRDTQLKHQAEFANYMLQSASPEHPLTPATSLAAAKIAQANGLANADDINKMMAAFNQGKDPTEVFKAIAQYGKQPKNPISIGAGGTILPDGTIVPPQARPAAPPTPGAGQHVINGQLVGPNGERIGPPVPPQKEATPRPAPNVGTFEDYVTRTYGATPTPAQILQARKDYGQADDRPRVNVNLPDQAAADVKEAVKGMKDGTIPPQLPGRASKEYTAMMAEAHRQGYDLAGAATDWIATQKHIATLNGAQQTRLRQAIGQLPDLLDSIDTLADKWKGGRFPVLNKANLALAKGGAYGKDAASIANQLEAQIADVTADLGNVYMGGNSPTDHALGLAAKALSADWDQKVLKDMTALARKNVQTRMNSINTTGVAGASEGNPYAPKPAAEAPPASSGVSVKAPNGRTYTFPTQEKADAFKATAGIK